MSIFVIIEIRFCLIFKRDIEECLLKIIIVVEKGLIFDFSKRKCLCKGKKILRI